MDHQAESRYWKNSESICINGLNMLKNFSKTLFDVRHNNERYASLTASIIDEELIIRRIDYNDFEINRKTGEVEGVDFFDKKNTKKLATHFRATTSQNLIRHLKFEFGKDGILWFRENLSEFCEEKGIVFTHEAYY